MWICALNSHLYTIARGLDNLSPVLQVASRRRHLRKLKDYVNFAICVRTTSSCFEGNMAQEV